MKLLFSTKISKHLKKYKMNIEENRLKTFGEWPECSPVNPNRLAKGGFYYTGLGTEVQCFLCGIRISQWDFGDQVMVRHRQSEPNCPFVIDPINTCNVPISSSLSPSSTINSQEQQQQQLPEPQEPRESTSFETLILRRPSVENVNLEFDSPEKYVNYNERLKSFDNWYNPAVSPESLARAGFYYLKRGDMVQCAFCHGKMTMWEPGDDPDFEHRSKFPNCQFYSKNNYNAALNREMEQLANAKLLLGTVDELNRLGIQKHSAPVQPTYATYDSRLRTFQGWPENLRQSPDILSVAGFYYVGFEDQVRCFHCDGGLHTWEFDDDPWTEHARWFPNCGFVAMVRGKAFIKHCIDNRPPLDPSILNGVDDEEVTEPLETRPPVPNNSSSNGKNHEITDAQVEELLHSPPAITALEIGLNVGRVKTALRQRMESCGVPFSNADQLIEHVRRIHLSEENNGFDSTPETSGVGELLNILLNKSFNIHHKPQNINGKLSSIKHEKSVNGTSVEKTKSAEVLRDKKVDNETEASKLSLEEENRRLKEARLCKICMDREVSVVFLPCGHLSTCFHCAPSLSDCPMCRREISATVRTFLA